MLRLAAILTILSAFTYSANAADWPAFRGPAGDGVYPGDESFPTEWGPKKNVRWNVKLPGDGNGSPIVSEGVVFVTTADAEGRKRRLHAFDRKSGEERWVRVVDFETVEKTHKTNPYAGTTPAADGKRVVVWHGSAGLFCYDFEGNEKWSRDPGDVGHMWGYGSSPVIHDGRVYLNFGPGEESFVTALDLESGDVAWKTEEPGGANARNPRMVGSWATPMIARVDGKEQLICAMPTRVAAYDLDGGDVLWSVEGLPSERGDLVYPSAVIAGDVGVAFGGYKGPSMAFKLGGEGDVTSENRIWRNVEGQPQRIGSGVVVDGYVYMANAGPGTAECIDVKTGITVWEKRLPGAHWGSVVLADGNLYVTNQDADTQVFKPNAEKFVAVATNKLDGSSNATPAFSNGEIFIRTSEALYCIGKK